MVVVVGGAVKKSGDRKRTMPAIIPMITICVGVRKDCNIFTKGDANLPEGEINSASFNPAYGRKSNFIEQIKENQELR